MGNGTILDCLYRYGYVVYTIQGNSMKPMLIPDRDIVVIIKRGARKLSENDVVLYQRKEKLMLHRIIKISDSGRCSILGDNCSFIDYDVRDEDIIGILIAVIHNGIRYEITSPEYLEYVASLRKSEKSRLLKKCIIDSISWNFRKLPKRCVCVLKDVLRFVFNYNPKFVKRERNSRFKGSF